MTRNVVLTILVFTLITTLSWMLHKRSASNLSAVSSNGFAVTVYKSPLCGCCEKWGNYMQRRGYSISTHEEIDMAPIKERFSVPYELESCHTSMIEGYVVEGHVPEEAIKKLLDERPDIKGIGMAGMPSGSPGMPGFKEDFLIYKINHDGTKGDLFIKL